MAGLKDRVVNLYLKGKDLFSPESKKAAAAIAALSDKADQLRQSLTGVSKAEREVSKAKALEEHLQSTNQQLSEAQAALAKATNAYDRLKTATEKQATASQKAESEAEKITAAYKKQQASLNTYNAELKESGINIDNLAAAQKEYEARIAGIKKELDDLTKAEKLLSQSKGLEAHIEEINSSLAEAKTKVKQYASAIDESAKASKEQTSELKLAEQAQRRLQKEYDASKGKLASITAELSVAVSGNKKLASSQTDLSNRTSELSAQLAELKRVQRDIAGANKLSASLQQSKADMDSAASRAKRLADEYRNTEIELGRLSREMTSASAAAGKADRNYTKIKGTLLALKEQLKSAGINTNDLTGAQKHLRSEAERLQGAIIKNRSELKAMGARMATVKDQARSAASSIKGLTGDLLAMGATYLGIREVGGALLGLLSTAGKFEDFRAQLSAIYDDQKKGEAAFAWIREFARDTPNTVAQVTEAFLLLKNNGMEPMDGTLRKLIAANAKYGRGQETLIPIIRQLSQAWGKNQITAEDAGTAIENGLPVWELLSKATGRTVGELRKMSENSQLTRVHLIALFDEMERTSLGTMAARMETWNAQVTKMKDQWQEFLDLIAGSGVLDYFKTQLTDINKEVRAMAEDGRLKAAAAEWAGWIVTTASATKQFVTGLVSNLDDLALKTSQVMGALQIGFNLFTGVVKGSAAVITGFLSAVTEAGARMAEAFGTDEMARKAREGAGAVLAIHKAFTTETLQDAKDIAAGWEKFTGQAYEATKKQFTNMSGSAAEAAQNQRKLIDEMIASAGDINDLINRQEEAFRTLGVKSAEVMNNLARDAKAAYEEIKAGDAPLAQQQKAFLSYAAAQIKAAAASGETVDATLKSEAAILNLSVSYDKLIEKYGEAAVAQAKMTEDEKAAAAERIKILQEEEAAAREKYVQLQEQLQAGTASAEQLQEAAQVLVSTTLELHTAQSNLAAGTQAQTKALESSVKVTLEAAKANAELARVNYDDIRKAFREGRASAQDLAEAHEDMAKASKALSKAMREQGREVQNTADDVADYSRNMNDAGLQTEQALKRQEKAAKKAYEAVERSFSAGNASAEQLRDSFLAWADSSIQASIATDQTVNSSLKSQAATLGLSQQVEALIQKYIRLKQVQQNTQAGANQASGDVVKGAQQMAGAMGNISNAGAAAATGIASVASYFSQVGFAVAAQLKELSAGAYAYFQTLVYGFEHTADSSSELDKAKAKIGELSEAISELADEKLRRADFVGLRTWALDIRRNGKIAEKAFYEQKVQVLELTEALDDAEQANLALISRAERAAKSLELVDDQTMDKLTRSIEKAKDKMDDLRESATDTLNELKDELDEFENRQENIEKRRYQQEKAELQTQLSNAKSSGDKQVIRQMEEALRTLEKVYQYRQNAVKQQQQEDEARAKEEAERAKEAEKQAKESSSNSTTASANASKASTYTQEPTALPQLMTATLYLHLEGQTASLSTKPQDLSNLMEMINQAKLTQGS
ncbi:MAG: hypothetical protein SwStaBPW_32810 [Shewanella algae]